MKIREVQQRVLSAIARSDPHLLSLMGSFAVLADKAGTSLDTPSFLRHVGGTGVDPKATANNLDIIIQGVPGLSTGVGQVRHYADLAIQHPSLNARAGGGPGKAITAVLGMGR